MLNKRLILLLPLLLISLPVFAGDFNLNAMSIGQVRQNPQLQQQIPVNGYFGMGDSNSDRTLLGQTNMRLFRDFDNKIDKQDLYQALFHYQPAEVLQIDAGRQFVNQGFFVEMLDGIQTTVTPWEHLDLVAYSGIPRSAEIDQFKANDGLLTGVSARLKNVAGTSFTIHSAWRKNDIHLMDLKTNDEIYVGGNLSHQFAIKMMPMLYGMVEYDPTGKVFDMGTAGLDIYPSNRIAFNMEFNYSNISRQTDRKTIQSLLTQGRLIGGRIATTWTLLPHVISLIGNYTYRSVVIQKGFLGRGHLAEANLQMTPGDIGLHIEPGYYFEKSYGGRVHGAKALIHEQFTNKLYADFTFDYAQYKKITNDNDSATSVIFWSGYEMVKGLTVSGGFEYNKNNFFNKDIRGSFRVDYLFDRRS